MFAIWNLGNSAQTGKIGFYQTKIMIHENQFWKIEADDNVVN
jgi:hypothetical protein